MTAVKPAVGPRAVSQIPKAVPSFLAASLCAPFAVALTTWVLLGVQGAVSRGEGAYVHPYTIGYVLPLALLARWGGRGPGLLALALSFLCSLYVLMAPHFSWRVSHPSDVTELLFLTLAGLLVVVGLDAVRHNVRLLAGTRARAEREALINRIGGALRRTLDPDEVQADATRALGQALAADRCYHIWYDADFGAGDIGPDWHGPTTPSLTGRHDFASVGYDPRTVFAGGGTAVMPDVREAGLPPSVARTLEALGHRAVLGVPLYDADRLVAALAVTMADGPRAWTPDEVALTEAVAAQTRSAVQSARAARRELTIATTLQDALQPPLPRNFPGLDLDAYYKPALREASVGGDFHDAFPLEKGVFALVVGDLSGKGLAAAAQVATVRNMLRFALYQGLHHGSPLAQSVTELNRVVTEQELLPGFVTLFVALYNAADLSLTYVSCGQEPALVRRAADGTFEELPPTGPVLGASATAVFDQGTVVLGLGDALAVFTDGLTEAGRTRREFLGVSGLADLMRRSPGRTATALVADVMAGVEAHADGNLHDDVCLLVAVAGGRPSALS